MLSINKRSAFITSVIVATVLLCSGASRAATCAGDCDGNGTISAGELTKIIAVIVKCNRVATGCAAVANGCTSADFAGDGTISSGDLTRAISNFIKNPGHVCPAGTPATATQPAATNTPVPAATNTPTSTATAAPTFTNTPGSSATPGCGDGVVQANLGEQCDDGGTCVGGANDGMKCPAGLSGHPEAVSCGAGVCTPFGGDGCASNCTTETSIQFTFTGAQCFGGAKNGQACSFTKTCTAGLVGKPCTVNANCNPPGGSGGVCTDECGTDGSTCQGVGVCTAGDANLIGTTCPSSPQPNIPPPVVKLCKGGTKAGFVCTSTSQCTGGGTCVNSCSPTSTTGVCVHRSGAVLQTVTFLGALGIGPLQGGQEMLVGQPLASDANKMIPVAVQADSVHFNPVRVPTLACACPRGVAEADVHGPGNSESGFIGCSASGLVNANVDITFDHNTTTPHICLGGPNAGNTCNANSDCPGSCISDNGNKVCLHGPTAGFACTMDSDCTDTCNLGNGPGACSGGTRAGKGCSTAADCPSGSCAGAGNGGGVCVSGTNAGKPCKLDNDCPTSICASPDDPTCTAVDQPPPVGGGDHACVEAKNICFGGGPLDGQPCQLDLDCGGNGSNGLTCGTNCGSGQPNTQGLHPGVCNSPRHLTFNPGPTRPGEGLIVTTTAIGVIATPADNGNCTKAAECLPLAFGASPTTCLVDGDCTGGKTCGSALCAGKCNTGPNSGNGCQTDGDCGGSAGSCSAGGNFGQKCTGTVPGECGSDNVCVPVNPSKGFDGLPCTADDAPVAKGVAATIPTTTATASSGAVDTNNVAGALMFGGFCSGATSCTTSVSGTPFNCAKLPPAANPSVSGAAVAAAFPQIDSATTGDGIVTNRQTAK